MLGQGCKSLRRRRPIVKRRVRSDRVVVLSPLLDDALCFLQTIEDFAVGQFIAKTCCDIPASRQASGAVLPCAINTSIWRSAVTICSALNLFFGITKLLSRPFSHNAWSKKARSGRSHSHNNIGSVLRGKDRDLIARKGTPAAQHRRAPSNILRRRRL